MNVIDRFLKYVSYDTQSDENGTTVPTTEKQKVLGGALAAELSQMGLQNAHMTEEGYVYGWLPATPGCEGVPCVGPVSYTHLLLRQRRGPDGHHRRGRHR